MRIFKSLVIAATAATLSTQATAGGFAAAVVEPSVVVIPEPAPVRRSSLGVILPLAILALLVGVAVSRDDDDDDEDTLPDDDGDESGI